jgi:hypothetical protein
LTYHNRSRPRTDHRGKPSGGALRTASVFVHKLVVGTRMAGSEMRVTVAS